MLDPEYYETAPDELSRIILTTQNWALMEIAARIKAAADLIPKSEWMLLRINMTRLFEADFKKRLSVMTEQSLVEIGKMFDNAAAYAHTYDQRLFEIRGVPFVEFKDNSWLGRLTHAAAEQTKDTFKNMTRTVGFVTEDKRFLPPREYFTQKLTDAEFQVAAGITSYDEAIKRTVRELVKSGLRYIEYPYAKPWKLEASVRTNILTGISNLSGEIAWKNIEALGLTIVETTAHRDARPGHVPWQGRRFALNAGVDEIKAKADAIHEADKGVRAMRGAERKEL